MKKLRFAQIGCGYIASNHIKALTDNVCSAELVSVCDVVEENASRISKQFTELVKSNTANKNIVVPEPAIYQDYSEMIDKENIDVCIIATGSGYHAEIAIHCLKYKKHVMVEKPMALSLSDAEQMIQIAHENRLKLGVCYQNRFKPAIRKLKNAIDNGRFGKIFAGTARILWNRNKEYYSQSEWRGTWDHDGGCLMNQCSHNIDLLQWMIGSEISSVYAQTSNFLHPYIQSDDYGSIIIRFKNGAIGNIEGTVCVYPRNLEESLSIFGETGTVVIGGVSLNKILAWDFMDKSDSIEQVQNECNTEIENINKNGHSYIYKNFIDSIKYDKPLLVNGQEGKKSLAIILMAYKSQQTSKPINFSKNLSLSTTDFR